MHGTQHEDDDAEGEEDASSVVEDTEEDAPSDSEEAVHAADDGGSSSTVDEDSDSASGDDSDADSEDDAPPSPVPPSLTDEEVRHIFLDCLAHLVADLRVQAWAVESFGSPQAREDAASSFVADCDSGLRALLAIIQAGCRPTADEWLCYCSPAFEIPQHGVYVEIAIPLVNGLPIVFYVGGLSNMTLPHGGIAARVRQHLRKLAVDTGEEEAFNDFVRPRREQYAVGYFRLWSRGTFAYPTASKEEVEASARLVLGVEAVLAELFSVFHTFPESHESLG